MAGPERGRRGGITTAPLPPVREKELAPPPTKEEVRAANAGEYAGATRMVKRVGNNRLLKIALGGGAVAAGGAVAYETVPAFHQAVDSAFLDHLKGKSSSSEASIAETVFDNNATKGVISEKNTVQLTREEYAKIAPPVINRENVQKVPVEFKIPPGLDGRTTRKLTLEQDTTINALVYVKTPEGKIREVSYTKFANPGKVTGTDPFPISFPGCGEVLGYKGEIQQGDIFPAPISGRVYYEDSHPEGYDYYKGQKLEDGTVRGDYIIEGEYYDKKTGEKFRARAGIHMLNVFTKPLVNNIPNIMDPVYHEKAKEGEQIAYNPIDARKKMPIVIMQQGEDLFKFIEKPPVQYFSYASPIKAQLNVGFTYEGGIGDNDIGSTFGGENCISPTLDNKAIVLK